MSRNRPNRIEITLSPEQLEALEIASDRLGTPKATLLRQWAFEDAPDLSNLLSEASKPSPVPKGSRVYSNAVEAAATAIPGVPRNQIEHAVAKVLIALAA